VNLVCDPAIAGGPMSVLPYPHAHHAGTFRDAFTEESGQAFSPTAFRDWRLRLLDSAHAMLVVRTELSESGAYEVAYNVHGGPRVPIFFAVHRSCPITTTLLQDLAPLVDARYVEFTEARELADPMRAFLTSYRQSAPAGRARTAMKRWGSHPAKNNEGDSRESGHAVTTATPSAVLVLEDGRAFHGDAYGAVGQTFGEAVFSTGMTGYQETLTDPSYHRQVVVMTAPHVGNTGVNDEDTESGRIWVAGYVVRDPSRIASNWRATRSLGEELEAQKAAPGP
jgi:hypothetical protein